MGFFDNYPYTDFHELNLDWVIARIKELTQEMINFEAANKITYAGVWNIAQGYPAWAVVTDSTGNGYISIQPVPAGVQIDNTAYWMKLYDFVTALGNLDQRVTSLEGAVSSLSGTVSNLNTRVGNAETSVSNLNTAVTNLSNSFTTYKNNRFKSTFSDRNILFVGDSYTNGGNVTKKWYETMCETILPGHYYVSTEGGEGFSAGAGKHYLDRIQDFINTSTAEVRNSITDLFITGGYNDITGTATDIINDPTNPYCMQKCVELARANFPNATIYIGYFARTPLVTGNTRHNIIYIERTATSYREGARFLNCKYIHNSEIMLHDYRWFDSDNVHPNQTGHNYLGHFMAQWFMNGTWSFNTDGNNNVRALSITHPDTVVEGHKCKLDPVLGLYAYEQLTDEGVFVRILNITSAVTEGGSSSYDCSPATSIAADTFNLGHINDTNFRAYFSLLGSNDSMKFAVNCVIRDGSNNYHDVPGIITVSSNNEILLNFLKMNGNNYQNYTGLNNVIISGIEFVLPLHSC